METTLQPCFFMCLHLCTRCLITAPNIVHVGVEETVSVQLHGATREARLTLYFKGAVESTRLCDPQIVALNEKNQYQAVVTLKASPHNCCLFVIYIDCNYFLQIQSVIKSLDINAILVWFFF